MSNVVLAVDCGTQSLRALLFDEKGRLLEFSRVMYEPFRQIKPGWAEQPPDIYVKSLCKAVSELAAKRGSLSDVSAISITTQRATVVCVDETGNPLRNAIVWLDQRKARPNAKIPWWMRIAHALVGMTESVKIAQMDAACNWIMQCEPEVWQKTHKFLLLSGFLNYVLTGTFRDSVASQVGHIPFNYKKRRWAQKGDLNWYLFPVDKSKLPELVNVGETIGYLTREMARATGLKEATPVIASGTDKGCETLGLGAISEDCAALSFGTTATVQVTTKKYFEPLRFMPSYPAVLPNHYNPEVEIFSGYWLVEWFQREFGVKSESARNGENVWQTLDRYLLHAPAGSVGLVVQPYWSPGLKIPEARGSMIGFGSVHTREHVYKAVVEGLGYALYDGLKKIERAGKIKVKKAVVAGGGSTSEQVCQITSDILGLPIYRGETHEAAGLGAAIATFVGLGEYSSFEKAVKSMIRYGKKFDPIEKNTNLYRKIYNEVYDKIYPRLRKLYKALREITNYPQKVIH